MDNITQMTTAWTPSFGMSAYGPCAHVRVFGAGVATVQGDFLAIARVKGAPGSPVWRPPTS